MSVAAAALTVERDHRAPSLAGVHPNEARVREWMTAEPIAVSAATSIDAAVT